MRNTHLTFLCAPLFFWLTTQLNTVLIDIFYSTVKKDPPYSSNALRWSRVGKILRAFLRDMKREKKLPKMGEGGVRLGLGGCKREGGERRLL